MPAVEPPAPTVEERQVRVDPAHEMTTHVQEGPAGTDRVVVSRLKWGKVQGKPTRLSGPDVQKQNFIEDIKKRAAATRELEAGIRRLHPPPLVTRVVAPGCKAFKTSTSGSAFFCLKANCPAWRSGDDPSGPGSCAALHMSGGVELVTNVKPLTVAEWEALPVEKRPLSGDPSYEHDIELRVAAAQRKGGVIE